jgi:hypothetical protein
MAGRRRNVDIGNFLPATIRFVQAGVRGELQIKERRKPRNETRRMAVDYAEEYRTVNEPVARSVAD